MKTNKILSLASIGIISTLLFSCNDNAWNDHELDGFENNGVSDVQSLKYTLTSTDYATLANNSDNKTIAEKAGVSGELKAVGTQGFFTDVISARDYVPALLTDPKFPFFTLSDGSSINLTYNVAAEMPKEIIGISNAYEFTVSDEDYQMIWESDTEYTNAFTPKHPASKAVPQILSNSYDDAIAGAYAIVNFNTSDMDPVFGSTTTPDFTMSNVLGTPTVGSTIDVCGVVTAVCVRGYILTDNAGSIFAYYGTSYDGNYSVGDQLVVNGTVAEYGNGLQLDGTTATVERVGKQTYTYPAPKQFTAADIEDLVNAKSSINPIYGMMTGKVVVSGDFVNLKLDDSTNFEGSIYYATPEIKEQLKDGEKVTVYGYLASKSSTKFGNIIVTKVQSANETRRHGPQRIVSVPMTNVSQVWYFDGNKWNKSSNIVALCASDYEAMGQQYGNLSSSASPEIYLPIFLKSKYPYAQANETKYIAYKYYDSSSKITLYRCDLYTYNGNEWVKFDGSQEETAQFVRMNGKWMYDPNVTITLPVGKGIEISTKYYQACVDWVYKNIDAKAPINSPSITSGKGYVTSYGNNEYYAGTSAFQGNVDLRPASARTQYPDGYNGMTDEEIVRTMKDRFTKEVLPAVLSELHPDATPIDGMDVIYTINFGVYTGANANYTVRYKVVGQAEFEFIDCDWD